MKTANKVAWLTLIGIIITVIGSIIVATIDKQPPSKSATPAKEITIVNGSGSIGTVKGDVTINNDKVQR